VSDVHQIVAFLAVAVTAGLLAASIWSWLTGRRSDGGRDHRFAVDRLILGTVGIVALNGLLGAVLMAGGSRPADPLHLLYGPVALLAPVLGWWLGGRRVGATVPARRSRRDAALTLASIVMLAIEFRLFATG
jgi:hypothetical protein